MAIYGKNFCWSAKEALSLLIRNVLRAFVVDKVADFLLFVGKHYSTEQCSVDMGAADFYLLAAVGKKMG